MSQNTTETQSDPAPRARKKSRLKWVLAIFTLAALAPTLAGVTGRQAEILRFLFPDLQKAISFKSATTHWWAPVHVSGIRIRDLSHKSAGDPDAQLLMTVESVSTRQPLWRIVLQSGRDVEVTVRKPVVNLCVHEGRTNLEWTAEEIFGPSTAGAETFPVVINVEQGTVTLVPTDGAGGRSDKPAATIDSMNGRFSTLNSGGALPVVSLTASIRQETPGNVATDDDSTSPLIGVNPRIAAAIDDLAGTHPMIPFTAAEVADLSDAEAPTGIQVEISEAGDSSGGQRCLFEARTLELSQLEPLLQRLLPDTRWDGTVSGRIEAFISGQSASFGLAGRAWLQGRQIRCRSTSWAAGESLYLEEVSGEGAWVIADDGILVDGLNVRSSVLDVKGDGEVRLAARNPVRILQDAAAKRSSGKQSVVNEAAAATTGQVRLQGRIDLAALSRMLPRTLRLDPGADIRSAEIRASCRLNSDVADARQPLDLARPPGGFRWQLAAETSPIEASQDGRVIEIESAVRLDADGHLSADMIGVDQVRMASSFGSLVIRPEDPGYAINGTLHPRDLWKQFQPILDFPRPEIAGEVQVATKVLFNADTVHLSQASLQSAEISIRSPELKIQTTGPLQERLAGQIDLSGSSSALKTLVAPWHSATWLADTSAVTLQLAAAPGRRFSVTAVVSPHGGSADSPGQSVSTGSAEQPTMIIDEARVAAELVADGEHGVFHVENGVFQIPGLRAVVTGTVRAPAGILLTDLDVTADYDLSELTTRLQGGEAAELQFSGQGRHSFLVRGCPLLLTAADVAKELARPGVSADSDVEILPLAVSGQVTWDGGRLYGLPLGPGTTRIQLQNGLLRTEPIHCTLGTGELSVMPQWDLNRHLVQLASGSRIQNLELSPEVCRQWLGYVAPVLTDAADVQGKLSARVQQFDLFPDHPAESHIQGVLSIHSGSASPGESVRPLLQLLELVRQRPVADRSIQLPPQEVAVEMSRGLVTHDGLELDVVGYRAVSRGSVGLNRQIQLVMDIPLKRSTAGQRGRSIQVPIGGTIDHPQISTQGLLQSVGQQEIENRLNQQIDRGLNKLFDKLR